MSITILDGSPWWYLSPDIWVVPGTEPDGPSGVPTVGEPAFIWCRIHNDGRVPVQNVVVDWADASTVITRQSATHVGRSYATATQESVEVLCVTPWIPSFINGGHGCLIVEISDSGPPPPSSVPFEPPAEPHVAQHNLVLAPVGGKKHVALSFAAGAGRRGTTLVMERHKLSQLHGLIERAGLPSDLKEADEEVGFGLLAPGADPCGEVSTVHELAIDGPQAAIVQIAGEQVRPGTAALVLVEERDGDRVLGGLAVVALHIPSAHAT